MICVLVITSLMLTGVLSSRLVVELDKERFLIRNCWKTDWFFNTLASVKPATNTHAHHNNTFNGFKFNLNWSHITKGFSHQLHMTNMLSASLVTFCIIHNIRAVLFLSSLLYYDPHFCWLTDLWNLNT